MADAAAVNAVLQRILAVTLDKGSAAAGQDPPVLFLEGLAEVRFEVPLGRTNTWQPQAQLLACKHAYMHNLLKHGCNVVRCLCRLQGQLHDGTCGTGLLTCFQSHMPCCALSVGVLGLSPPNLALITASPVERMYRLTSAPTV